MATKRSEPEGGRDVEEAEAPATKRLEPEGKHDVEEVEAKAGEAEAGAGEAEAGASTAKKSETDKDDLWERIHDLHGGGSSLTDSLFSWKDWDEGFDTGDMQFDHCVMKVDVCDKDGNVLIAKGDKASFIDWAPSKSRMEISPVKGKPSGSAIICTINAVLSVDGVLTKD